MWTDRKLLSASLRPQCIPGSMTAWNMTKWHNWARQKMSAQKKGTLLVIVITYASIFSSAYAMQCDVIGPVLISGINISITQHRNERIRTSSIQFRLHSITINLATQYTALDPALERIGMCQWPYKINICHSITINLFILLVAWLSASAAKISACTASRQ